MAKTKIAVLWGVLIAMMVACAGIYATLKAREMNPVHRRYQHPYRVRAAAGRGFRRCRGQRGHSQ